MALVWTVALMAQRIAVVDSIGSTQIYKTFDEAIRGATNNSVIYLPGGVFTHNYDVRIMKKLTIIGIGHKTISENPDGHTVIDGALRFDKGSDGSALLGCYLKSSVYIGEDGDEVKDVLIRYNAMNYMRVGYNCKGTNIDQNYIRDGAEFNYSSGRLTNNIVGYVLALDDGFISNNIITSHYIKSERYVSWVPWSREYEDSHYYALMFCERTSITNNIICDSHIAYSNDDCWISGNMCVDEWGDDCITVGTVDWKDVFVDYQGITSVSDFHFKEGYKQYQGRVGIYSGDGFSDEQLAPVPYIVAKKIDQQTDASGKLNVKIRVKAGE